MAETLTVNTDAPTETADVVENLTPDEQDSLQVGEEMMNQQEQLLAGKYKNAEDLEKAYDELQSKLGEKSNQDNETVDEAEVQQPDEVQEETSQTSETTEYLEDGTVNYATANEIYGEKLGNLFQESKIDPFAINNYFQENNGTLSEEHYGALEGAGLTRQTVDAYLQGITGAMSETDSNDISDSTVAEIKNFAGGDEAYTNIVNWASNNLGQNEVNAFDEVINSGSVDAIKLAVSGLKSRFEDATGREGTVLTGKAPATTPEQGFRSQAELVRAMSDKRYDNDPAYRQDVIAKLERSNDLAF